MYVFGNGESRASVDIDKLDDVKIGCNAIYRDYVVDHLVCVDNRMVLEAIDAVVNDNALIYTRVDWIDRYKKYSNITTVPELPYNGTQRWDEPFNWGSGPYAVLLAATLCKGPTVRLVGFDLYSTTATVNNVYKGTSNYDASDKKAVDPRYWIHQIGMVFKCYPNLNFVVYNTETFKLPEAWIHPNVTVDTISNL
jgi:hypothetical protein